MKESIKIAYTYAKVFLDSIEPDNHFLLDWSYRPTVTKNNVDVGKIMASFIGWMTKKGYRSDGPAAQAGATEASP